MSIGGRDATSGAAAWLPVLLAAFALQVAIMVAIQALPIAGPLLTAEAGLPSEAIGYLTGTAQLGTVLYLLVGGPIIPRFGAMRTLQAGAAGAAVALLVVATGIVPALFLGALLLGIANGPTVPAGSRILTRNVPAEHRTLIFSIKQSGAPLGGILAGILLPAVVLAAGWQSALLLAALVALASAWLVQPLRARLDADRDAGRPIGWRILFAPTNIAASFTALRSHPALLPLCGLCVAFAVVQGCFVALAVTFLTAAHGYSLAQAGAVFAALQVGGFAARILLAWLADRTGAPCGVLLLMLAGAAVSVLGFALLAGRVPHAVTLALAFAVGATGLGWQGIALAELTRLAPPDRVAEATAGATISSFLTYFAAPTAFAALVALSDSWVLPMLVVAAQAGIAAVLLAPRLAPYLRIASR